MTQMSAAVTGADAAVSENAPPEAEVMTMGEIVRRCRDLADKVEKIASKSTLVERVAHDTVTRAWFLYGSLAKVVEEEERLLTDLKGWAKNGQLRNQGKRLDRLLARSK